MNSRTLNAQLRHLCCAVLFASMIASGCDSQSKPRTTPSPFSSEARELADAVNRDDARAIESWVSKGRSPDIVFLDGTTALHSAAGMGHLASVNALLQGGASVNVAAKDGRTPLHYAAELHTDHQLNIVRILLRAGADRNARDRAGKTSYDYAVADANEKCAELLKSGAP